MTKTSYQGIWWGDVRQVREARTAYVQDPKSLEVFFRYASALYSFRFLPWYRKQLIRLITRHSEGAYLAISNEKPTDAEKRVQITNWCDMLATYYLWASRKLRDTRSRTYRIKATALCDRADSFFQLYGIGDEVFHTWCLIHLTHAGCLIEVRRNSLAIHRLDRVRKHVDAKRDSIPDLRQRVRIFAKLGLLYRRAGYLDEAEHWRKRAHEVPDVPFFVRLKAIVAGLG